MCVVGTKRCFNVIDVSLRQNGCSSKKKTKSKMIIDYNHNKISINWSDQFSRYAYWLRKQINKQKWRKKISVKESRKEPKGKIKNKRSAIAKARFLCTEVTEKKISPRISKKKTKRKMKEYIKMLQGLDASMVKNL